MYEDLTGESGKNELSLEMQTLADMADKMTEQTEENKTEFDENGINKETGTKFDKDGYDRDGFDDIGVDREGFDREGYGTDDRDREGFDREGYDKDGFDKKGFDKDGIHKFTGNEYDRGGYNIDGYNREGFDREGYNREGYRYGIDREGYNRMGYDSKGYDREGFNMKGFNRDGINRETGTEFNQHGFNRYGIHESTGTKYDTEGYDERGRDKDGYSRDGYNWYGRDKDGFDRNNLDINGFNRDGVNKDTGTLFDKNGFDKNGIHANTKEKYDSDGYDRNGLDADGYNRRGFNKDGYHKITGKKYDLDGYNQYGINREHYDRDGFRHDYITDPQRDKVSVFNKDGYDKDGYNWKGMDRDGFDKNGYDSEGYDRSGLDRDGNSREYNAKFNKYGVDENGYCKNGEIDSDVEFAITFAESGAKDKNTYARNNGVDVEEVNHRMELARKKCPKIDSIISSILATGNKMRVAAISEDCTKFMDGEMSLEDLYGRHPRLNAVDMISNFVGDTDRKKKFANITINSIVMDTKNIETNLQVFGTTRYSVEEAMKGADEFKKIYARIGTDGSQEQALEKRVNTKKLYDIMRYLNKYKNRNMDVMIGSRISRDGGKTWIEFTGKNIGEAMDKLKEEKKLICVQTVRDFIVNSFPDSVQQ